MGAIRTTPSGYLYFDFRYRGVRCREYTTLQDSPANRKKMEQVLARVQAEITLGTFDYGAYFPGGSRAALFTRPPAPREDVAFEPFALQWYEHNKVSWKPSVAHEFLGTLKKHLFPRFEGRSVTEVTAADVKRLRADLAQCPGRKGRPLSAKRINNICGVLRLILAEAANHFGIGNPFDTIKPLPVPKSDIDPFTFEEMAIFLHGVREDFYNYYFVRFMTGMRTGEIDALGWEHVDWLNKKLRVRRGLYRGQFVPPKTSSSVRDIDLLPPCGRHPAGSVSDHRPPERPGVLQPCRQTARSQSRHETRVVPDADAVRLAPPHPLSDASHGRHSLARLRRKPGVDRSPARPLDHDDALPGLLPVRPQPDPPGWIRLPPAPRGARRDPAWSAGSPASRCGSRADRVESPGDWKGQEVRGPFSPSVPSSPCVFRSILNADSDRS